VDVDEHFDDDFAARAETHRRELRVHCYRLTGSFDEAEDLVQEVLVRAWRSRDQLADDAGLRAWLYKIATNICLDFLRRVERRPRAYAPVPGMDHGTGSPPDFLEWLQPFPDTLLDPQAPDAEAVARETIELVFLTAIQHLTPPQRAVFVFREVLGWSAADTAAAMDLSVASVNSTLQRAKPSLRRHLPEDRAQWRTQGPTPEERKVIDAYLAASQSGSMDAVAELLTSDVVLTMPAPPRSPAPGSTPPPACSPAETHRPTPTAGNGGGHPLTKRCFIVAVAASLQVIRV
jgi:RNA polymerase sigma-70 factor (TIGR02960 family)